MARRVDSSNGSGQSDPVQQALSALADRHDRVKSLSDSLTERIQQFEEWIGTLPGRVPTTIALPDPDRNDEYEIAIGLERAGKKWLVNYAYIFHGDYEGVELKPLSEAGVKTKALVLPLLPKLIEAMVGSQERLAEQIEEANKEFDAFALRMKLPARKGQ